MIRFFLIFITFVSMPLSACKAETNPSSYGLKLSELQSECAGLSDEKNRVFKAVKGNYIRKNSLVYTINAATQSHYAVVTLKSSDQKYTITSETFEGREGDEFLDAIIRNVVLVHKEKPQFESFIFGICAAKKEDGTYLGDIETIKLLKEK